MYVDLAYILRRLNDWLTEKPEGFPAGLPQMDAWAVIDSALRSHRIKVGIYDDVPADGSRPRNAAMHEDIQRHPRVQLRLRRSQHPPHFDQREIEGQIICDLLADARRGVKHMVLVTGDQKLLPAIETVRKLGVHVTIAAFFQAYSHKPLQLEADDTIDLDREPVIRIRWSPAPELPA